LVRSFDGTEIAVRSSLSGEKTPVLLVNAVGATLAIWRQTLAAIAPERPWIAWDMRGLHDSLPPRTDRLDAAAHAGDAIAALDRFDVGDLVIASWSNGSRIAFEIAAAFPGRVRALAVVNGGYGQSLAALVKNLEPASALPLLAGVAKHFPAAVGVMFRQLVARPELAGLIRQSGLAGPAADPAFLIEMLRSMAQCDTHVLLATYEAVAGSSAVELLPSVDASTLLIAGGRDRISPGHIVQEIEAAIPRVRVEVYEDATHYLPLEYPDRLAASLSRFFSEVDGSLS
jgi:pimeloyl-ACP methyl ester carboxylesterase